MTKIGKKKALKMLLWATSFLSASSSFKSEKQPIPFLNEEDDKLYKAVAVKSFQVQI
jgi:hypothetical protein